MSEFALLVSVFALLLTHWVADFVLQNNWMALNKSKDSFALTIHCGIYTLIMSFVFILINAIVFEVPFGFFVVGQLTWALFFSHFLTDYFTSRLNAYLWRTEQRHWFFVSIGFDQLIHFGVLLCLLASFLL